VGFESSQVARRRLAALASRNGRVQEALAPSAFPGWFGTLKPESSGAERSTPWPSAEVAAPPVHAAANSALIHHLDDLAQDIVSIPGAGGALLAAYAAQARALTMILEAAKRAGSDPLPAAVLRAAQDALTAPSPLTGLALS